MSVPQWKAGSQYDVEVGTGVAPTDLLPHGVVVDYTRVLPGQETYGPMTGRFCLLHCLILQLVNMLDLLLCRFHKT
jgi:hypothetical protein